MTNLRNAREQAGLTREELARRAGTSTSTVARMELAGHVPNGATIVRLSAVLGVPVDVLIPQTAPVSTSPEAVEAGVSVSGDAA